MNDRELPQPSEPTRPLTRGPRAFRTRPTIGQPPIFSAGILDIQVLQRHAGSSCGSGA